MTYDDARRTAQAKATATGLDYGIEKFPMVGFTVRALPRPENRFGADLRAEVVRPNEPEWKGTR